MCDSQTQWDIAWILLGIFKRGGTAITVVSGAVPSVAESSPAHVHVMLLFLVTVSCGGRASSVRPSVAATGFCGGRAKVSSASTDVSVSATATFGDILVHPTNGP